MSSTELVNVQIDGVWHQVAKGTKVIEACAQAGKFIPRYCYHPRLTAPGNCRMCMVQLGMPRLGADRKPELDADGRPVHNWIPRPQISCAQDVSEGLGVRTDSDIVKEARRGVMEFLLINHPLDCPICDQAGECRLQEFALDYGAGTARFAEEKTKKPKRVELGPRVTLDAERCVLCTRCIRFMREVAGDDCIGIVQRGGENAIACHDGRKLESNYSLNTVDICPVGALTSTDFRFKMRTWFLKETKSICTSCATGCNVTIAARENIVYRQTPRENAAVNQSWMCDYGRLYLHGLHGRGRLMEPSGGDKVSFNALPRGDARRAATQGEGAPCPDAWDATIADAVKVLSDSKPEQIAVIASGRLTNEEMFLAAQLIQKLGVTHCDIIPHEDAADNFLLSADRNPNTAGAKRFGLVTGRLADIEKAVQRGEVKTMLVLGEDVPALAEKCKALIVIGALPNATTAAATHVLPGLAFAEKRGTMINKSHRLQRLQRAVAAPGLARDDWEILAALLEGVGGPRYATFEAVHAAAFPGLTFDAIGDLGIPLQEGAHE